ncbi:MAG: (2Fe-2S)-binding protein [Syntrophobacteraceae bacterium]|jgi:carbon-monoxide dehydrogenase small subunit
MKYPMSFVLNGISVDAYVKPTETLLDVLREHMNVKSPKRGCDSGDCGACTVLLEGAPVQSCLTLALTVTGKRVETLEGFMDKGELHPLQAAFVDYNAVQCGFCAPGMLISAKALLDRNPQPSRDEIVEAVSGHLCRCGGYVEVIEAVEAVAKQNRGKE